MVEEVEAEYFDGDIVLYFNFFYEASGKLNWIFMRLNYNKLVLPYDIVAGFLLPSQKQ